MKKKIYKILSVSKETGDTSWWFDMFIITLISLNVFAVIIESVEAIRKDYQFQLNLFETISVIIFAAEYFLRVWTANENPKFKKLVTGNIQFACTPFAIIDLLSFLPSLLPLVGIDLRFLRVLRLSRLFRLLKIVRYLTALKLITNVIKSRKEELGVSIVFVIFMLLITSTLMYYTEHSAQPDNFSSIPQTMWWAIATLTTVGYGDIFPITGGGKFLGGIIAVLGVGLFALPSGILAAGFSDELAKKNSDKNACPHCGMDANASF